jgi:K+-sensing histidine kinase KdpD
MADGLKCRWLAVHVEGPQSLTSAAQTQLEKNLAAARELGAEAPYSPNYMRCHPSQWKP